jgi:hypothetical protein
VTETHKQQETNPIEQECNCKQNNKNKVINLKNRRNKKGATCGTTSLPTDELGMANDCH